MKGVLPWLIYWACNADTRDFCSVLAALVGTVQNIFTSLYTISIPLSSSPSKLDRQPCWVACLLVCVFGSHPAVPFTQMGFCNVFFELLTQYVTVAWVQRFQALFHKTAVKILPLIKNVCVVKIRFLMLFLFPGCFSSFSLGREKGRMGGRGLTEAISSILRNY